MGMKCGTATQNNAQFRIHQNSGDSRRDGRPDEVVRGDIPPKRKPRENTSDDVTDSGSYSDSGEETIISDEIQEHSVQQPNVGSKPDACVPDQLQGFATDDKQSATSASVPPVLLGEIRKMIQEERKSCPTRWRVEVHLLTDME